MRAMHLRRILSIGLALFILLSLTGCGAGEESARATSSSPSEQLHEYAEQASSEGGEEMLRERRQELEEAQEAREEDPVTGEEAQAEGAEARDAIEAHEEELQAAEEPEPSEHEPGAGRLLREG